MLRIIFWVCVIMVLITLVTIAVDEHNPAILFHAVAGVAKLALFTAVVASVLFVGIAIFIVFAMIFLIAEFR